MKPLIYAMPGSEDLAKSLAKAIGATLGMLQFRRFPDGESYVRIGGYKTLSQRCVAVVCRLDRPDEKTLPLLFLADTLRSYGAKRVGLISPYLPYMRQDKRFRSGEALTSASFAGLLSSRFNWLVTVDPHLHRYKTLNELYGIPAEAVAAAPLISAWIKENVNTPIVIGPDEESEQWVAAVADGAQAPYRVSTKTRMGDRSVRVTAPNKADIAGHTPVIVDDIISTARTMIETIKGLRQSGSPKPVCIGVHGIFAEQAYIELKKAGAGEIITCNTFPHPTNRIDISAAIAPSVARFLDTAHWSPHEELA